MRKKEEGGWGGVGVGGGGRGATFQLQPMDRGWKLGARGREPTDGAREGGP